MTTQTKKVTEGKLLYAQVVNDLRVSDDDEFTLAILGAMQCFARESKLSLRFWINDDRHIQIVNRDGKVDVFKNIYKVIDKFEDLGVVTTIKTVKPVKKYINSYCISFRAKV